jgi:hypothetical protein
MTADDKLQLHISHLLTFLDCGWLYYLVYIVGWRARPGIATVRGHAVHGSVDKDLTSKKDTGQLLTVEEVQDTARDLTLLNWDKCLQESDGFLLNKTEAEKGLPLVKAETIDLSVQLATLHHDKLAPVIQPAHLERPWVIELPDFPMDLAGKIDQQETMDRGGIIRDVKTGKGMGLDVNLDPQLTMYWKAVEVLDGYDAPVAFDLLKTTKVPKLGDPMESTRSAKHWEVLCLYIESFFRARELGDFQPCNPRYWKHSPLYCGFYGNGCKFSF